MPTETLTPDALAIPWGRIALVLLLTAAATAALAWGARGRARGGRGSERLLALVDTLPLGPQRTLHVIEAGGRRMLIAATPAGVTALGDLTPAAPPAPPPEQVEEPAAIEPAAIEPAAPKEPSPFDRVLRAVRGFDSTLPGRGARPADGRVLS